MMDTTKNQMLFIAELMGYGKGTTKGKVDHGLRCYTNRKLHILDLDNEHDRSELHENIWLERLYDEIDYVHGLNDKSASMERLLAVQLETISNSTQWTVPLEVDATSLT